MQAIALAALLIVGASAFGTNCHRYEKKALDFPQPTQMPNDFKVVFLGDAGADASQRAVLNLAVAFNPHVIVHAGDFDYDDDPSNFLNNINAVVPSSIPYFAAIGNHDEDAWEGSSGYQSLLLQRLARSNASQFCTGDFGVNAACYYKGMYFVLSGVGTQGSGHVQYLRDAFEAVPAVWKTVVIHKNQRLYQIGGKEDETGYEILDAAREYGAIISTGHEHSFSRTHLMSNFARQTIASTSNNLTIQPGRTFLWVSGLGGESIREWEDELNENPWWAATGASNNGVGNGAIFCTFNIGGVLRQASCYFQDTKGQRFDSFSINNQNPDTIITPAADKCTPAFIDIAVSASSEDAREELISGTVSTTSPLLVLGTSNPNKPALSAIRFNNIPLTAESRIKTAHLQFFGLKSKKNFVPTVSIRAERSAKPSAFEETAHNLSLRERTNAAIAWTQENEDFDTKTVWVTPNIKSLLQEVISLPDWHKGNSIVFTLEGFSNLAVSSFDRSSCLAPSIIIELESDC